MATVAADTDQYTPECACGWRMPRYADATAAHQAADLHARDCPTEPMLPLSCPTCQDQPSHCPQMSNRAPLGRFPLPLLGGCVDPLQESDIQALTPRWD